MNKILKSKIATLLCLAIIIAIIAITFQYRIVWWTYIDIFLLFMATFSHLLALCFRSKMSAAAVKLDNIALWCGIFGVLAFVIESIIYIIAYT